MFSLNFVKVSGCSICDLNTIGISKGNVVRHYVDLIIKVFEENFEITQGKWGEVGSWMLIKVAGVWGLLRPKSYICG